MKTSHKEDTLFSVVRRIQVTRKTTKFQEHFIIKSEVLTMARMETHVSWDVTLCQWVSSS